MRKSRKPPMTKKQERTHRAHYTLIEFRALHPDYRNSPEEPDEAAFIDLFTDLMHLAKKMGQKPESLVRTAANHFEEEDAVWNTKLPGR